MSNATEQPSGGLLPPFSADWAFFLDIDGTLLDFAPTPDAVVPDELTRELLIRLQQRASGAVALISGRAARDIDRLFEPLRFPIAGQHGVERRDAAGNWHKHALPEHELHAASSELEALCRAHPGLVFENKGLNLAVHYRLAPECGELVHRRMIRLMQQLGPRFEVQGGKMIWEIKPSGRDKGMAIIEFLAEVPFAARTPVFVGDDVTDESAFQAVNKLGGLSIKVGPGATAARFRLADAAAVRAWLGSWADWSAARGRASP